LGVETASVGAGAGLRLTVTIDRRA